MPSTVSRNLVTSSTWSVADITATVLDSCNDPVCYIYSRLPPFAGHSCLGCASRPRLRQLLGGGLVEVWGMAGLLHWYSASLHHGIYVALFLLLLSGG